MEDYPRPTRLGLILRVGLFALIGIAGLLLFANLIMPLAGYFAAATLGNFAAAAVATAIVLRIYERGQLSDIGLGWTGSSRVNLGLGVAGGVGAAVVVVALPLLAGAASLERVPDSAAGVGPAVFVSILLLFGAVGEEMLFRGYAFQLLAASVGRFATILPVSVVFGLAHSGNQSVSWLALFNTIAWGALLGWAFFRSGDLWLPIGLHFGWNWTLPLTGANLSGFTMSVTGYAMRWRAHEFWSGGNYGPEGSILTTFVVIALFVYLARAPVRKQKAFLLRGTEEEEEA